MKRTSTVLAVALMLSTAVTAVYGFLTRQGLTKAQQLTVLIDNVGFLGRGRGTGVLIDETHVLTCAHMINMPRDEFFVYTYPLGAVVKATVEMVDKNDDLAILALSSPVVVPVKAVFAEAEIGDEVTVVGNALGSSEWVVTHGIVSGKERGFLLTDATINPGNSGGPWINDKGQIVAISDWSIGPDSDHHMRGICGGVDAKVIQNALNQYAMLQKLQEMLLK